MFGAAPAGRPGVQHAACITSIQPRLPGMASKCRPMPMAVPAACHCKLRVTRPVHNTAAGRRAAELPGQRHANVKVRLPTLYCTAASRCARRRYQCSILSLCRPVPDKACSRGLFIIPLIIVFKPWKRCGGQPTRGACTPSSDTHFNAYKVAEELGGPGAKDTRSVRWRSTRRLQALDGSFPLLSWSCVAHGQRRQSKHRPGAFKHSKLRVYCRAGFTERSRLHMACVLTGQR